MKPGQKGKKIEIFFLFDLFIQLIKEYVSNFN